MGNITPLAALCTNWIEWIRTIPLEMQMAKFENLVSDELMSNEVMSHCINTVHRALSSIISSFSTSQHNHKW